MSATCKYCKKRPSVVISGNYVCSRCNAAGTGSVRIGYHNGNTAVDVRRQGAGFCDGVMFRQFQGPAWRSARGAVQEASLDHYTIEWPVTTAGNSDMILLAQAAAVLCGALQVLACGRAVALGALDHYTLLPANHDLPVVGGSSLDFCDGAVVRAYG
jgi:hypothetical protein